MFKLAPIESLKCQVDVSIPQDKGKTKDSHFFVEFKLPSVDELEDIGRTIVVDAVRAFALSWEGVQDEDGEELEFTSANLDKLLNVTYVQSAMCGSYNKMVRSLTEIRSKN
jgi:hypothetical protein